MTRRGSLLFEMVIALGIFTSSAIVISGVMIRSARMLDRGREQSEATDLAASALTLITVGVISPEGADQLSEHELRGLLEGGTPSQNDIETRYQISVETEPTSWRTLTRVTVLVTSPGSDATIAETQGLIDLGRIRDSGFRRFDS